MNLDNLMQIDRTDDEIKINKNSNININMQSNNPLDQLSDLDILNFLTENAEDTEGVKKKTGSQKKRLKNKKK